MVDLTKQYLRQLSLIIEGYELDLKKTRSRELTTSALAAIDRIAGKDSIYYEQSLNTIKTIEKMEYTYSIKVNDIAHHLVGIIRSLYSDISNGFLIDFLEIVHGEVFSDFLEMSDYLAQEGYKDAAAVMTGGVLESHLRQLAIKHGIALEITINSDIRPKKADLLNSELAKQKVYNVLEQKNVTAWLDLRNKAAHAKYEEYTKDHVSLMLHGVRSFITRYPA